MYRQTTRFSVASSAAAIVAQATHPTFGEKCVVTANVREKIIKNNVRIQLEGRLQTATIHRRNISNSGPVTRRTSNRRRNR